MLATIEQKILSDKLRIAYKNLIISVPINLLCAAIVFISLRQVINSTLILTWFIATILVSLFRILALYYYHHQPNKEKLHTAIFVFGTLASAALWGIAGSYLMPSQDLVLQMIIIIIIAGVTAGGIQTLQANLAVSIFYVLFTTLPLSIWLLVQHSISHIALGLSVTIYLIFMLATSFRGNKILEETLKLRYANSELFENLLLAGMQLQQNYSFIEKSETLLRTIQENAPIGLAVISLKDELLEVNHALCQILGYDAIEFKKLTSKQIIHPDDFEVHLQDFQRLIQGKTNSVKTERRYIHKNGQLIWVFINLSLVYNSQKEPLYFIAQIENITERKQRENEVVALNERTKTMLAELQHREIDMAFISKMNDLLQACQNLSEAETVIHHSAKELFPSFSGGIMLFDESTYQMETTKQWGDQQILKTFFNVDDCWALRETHSYLINDAQKELVCKHFITPPKSGAMCIPLIGAIGIVGMLFLAAPMGILFTHYQQQIAIAFSDVIRLSLANIRLRATLREQSIHDPLTGLYNRRYLDESLKRELHRIEREKSVLCVAMLDIDLFKRFNDTHGHEAGDEVLKIIGIILQDHFRGSDIAARFGGEEFILVLIGSDLNAVLPRLEDIRTKIKNAQVYFERKRLPQITVSIGVAEAPLHGKTIDEIIKVADEALYLAKKEGRDRITVFSSKNLIS